MLRGLFERHGLTPAALFRANTPHQLAAVLCGPAGAGESRDAGPTETLFALNHQRAADGLPPVSPDYFLPHLAPGAKRVQPRR